MSIHVVSDASHQTALLDNLRSTIARDGFAILRGVFDRDRVAAIVIELTRVLEEQPDDAVAIRSSRERVVAARNLLQVWPRAAELASEPAIRDAVTAILGAGCGVVRTLFFDKPPGRSWTLPWHQDKTIAVRDNRLPTSEFSKPTVKAGVPHVEASDRVLEGMLTARIHLDDVTDENGPLLVAPGSHRTGRHFDRAAITDSNIRPILVSAGDVLLMRPLVAHSSGNAHEDTTRHRRIVHLEFASSAPLADGYEWHDFRRIDGGGA